MHLIIGLLRLITSNLPTYSEMVHEIAYIQLIIYVVVMTINVVEHNHKNKG